MPSSPLSFVSIFKLACHFLLLTFLAAGSGKLELGCEQTQDIRRPAELRNGGSL